LQPSSRQFTGKQEAGPLGATATFNFLFSDDTGAIWCQMKPLQGMHAIVGVLSSARKIFLQPRLPVQRHRDG
jgi:hypothetical protein